jgi:formate dehydrogenase subunit beta
MNTIIPVKNGEVLPALRRVLRGLIEIGVVEMLLVPMRTPLGSVTPALVSNPELLDAADPLAPVMPVNGATLAGMLSVREPRTKVGVVLRSCELRALVELIKVQQAHLDDLVLIAVDCAGTFEVPVFQKLNASGGASLWKDLFLSATTDPTLQNPELRLACRMCEKPVYDGADITIELLGSDLEQGVRMSLSDEIGDKLGLTAVEPNGREGLLDKYVAARKAVRDSEFEQIRDRLEGADTILGVFDACIRCHNCMTVCPVCYCKTCVFKSPVFDHEPMQFVGWANQKGALRLPADTLLFHLTRLNHMGLSCVGCGMCTQACPADLPVGVVFRAIGQRLQEAFDYAPGRDPEETLPLITFKEDEWTDLGE